MAYKFTSTELSKVKQLAKAINVDWKTLAARPDGTRKMLLEWQDKGTINGEKVTASEEYVWQVKNKKQEQVNGSDPVKAMTEFGQKHGTRGEIRITRWQRTGGDMMTSTGVNFKGTFKEVVEKLKHFVATATATANGGSFKTNWTPAETKLFTLLKSADYSEGIELESVRQQLAGRAWDDLNKIPKPVDQAIENLVRSSYAMKVRRKGTWYILPVEIGHRGTIAAASKKKPAKQLLCFPEHSDFEVAYAKVRKLKGMPEAASLLNEVTTASGLYLDAVSGSRPDASEVSQALMDIITEVRAITDPGIKDAGDAVVRTYRDFRDSYTKWLRETHSQATAAASGKTVQETAEALLKKHKDSYSPEIDVDATTKAIENALSIVKDLFEGDHCSKFDAAMAIRAAGVLMHKGNKQQSVLGHEVIVRATPSGSATADFDTEIDATPDTEKPASGGSSLLGNAVIGDVKRTQSLIATWSKKKGKGAPPPEQLKEYVAYQKDVAGYIVKTYLPKLPDNYKAKVKAI